NNLNIQSDEIVNNQAILQTQYGAISLVANSIQNLSSDPKIKGEFIDGARKSIVNGTRIATTNIARDRAGYTYNSYNIYTDIMSYEPYTKAKILSGNNLYIDSKNLTNQYSMIFSNNDMFLDIGELSNKSKDIVQLTTTNKHIYLHHEEKKKWYKGKGTKHSSVYAGTTTSYDVEVIDSIDSTIEARNSIFANLDKLSNGMIENKTKEINDFDLTSTKQIDKVPILLELPTNQYGLYVAVAPDKNLDYLVESNPLYANFANYVGSSYFLEKLNYQGDKIAKRLGDAGYETKIVSDQIVMMSGNRFLSANYLDENDQFVALMDNALEYISTIDTQIGKALSNSQIAMLEKDIVWMEEKKINEQVVLVPVIYLANKDKKDATIYAKNIDLQINDSLYNSGTIKADENINIKTASLSNNSGDILAKNSILIDSKDNIINKNGSLMKANNIYLNASNVINQTYVDTNKVNSTNGNFIYTVIGNKSSIKATDGDLVIVARDSIINSGANLEAKNNLFLQTQDGDINLYAIKLENGYNFYFDKGYQFTRKTDYLTSNLKANNIFLQSANDINLVASKLNATNLIDLEAKNNINSLALNKENYKDTQITSKGTFSKKTQRDMSYKQSVESAKLEAKDIYLHSGNDINLQATTLIAKDEKIAYATNSLNILAQIYKEGELHHTSKSSFGGMIKSEYKYENDHLKIKSSQITADNMILDAKTINLESSQIKAKTMEITTDILNMISSKESIYENEFSNKGGILTATIINQGKIEEIVIPSIIEVNDKLIFNKQDITDQLEINNLLKILSSQGDLTIEQINLVKQIVSLQEWYDKTTTLSGMGALIVTAITTYFTAGSGAGLIEGISNAAIKTATQSVIDSVIIQATTSLANSVITGNKLQLDIETIISSAISAGVLSYVNSSLGTNALTDDMTLSDYVKNATIHGVGQGISSEIRDGEFKDGFATGALITVVSDGALQMRKYVKDN
ncbi:MAG: hypothetical protein RBQ81_09095, partial [Arcobacteraceae bacterium]|nr:hypothetical protein [Arcobacteraceae bacterium]